MNPLCAAPVFPGQEVNSQVPPRIRRERKGENFFSAWKLFSLWFSGFISRLRRLPLFFLAGISFKQITLLNPPKRRPPSFLHPAPPAARPCGCYQDTFTASMLLKIGRRDPDRPLPRHRGQLFWFSPPWSNYEGVGRSGGRVCAYANV